MKHSKLSPISSITASPYLSRETGRLEEDLSHSSKSQFGSGKEPEATQDRLTASFSSGLSIKNNCNTLSMQSKSRTGLEQRGSPSLDTGLLSSALKKKRSVIPPINNTLISLINPPPNPNLEGNALRSRLALTHSIPSLPLDEIISNEKTKSKSKRVLKATLWTRREILARSAEERLAAAQMKHSE
jgi:hypothetical protein